MHSCNNDESEGVHQRYALHSVDRQCVPDAHLPQTLLQVVCIVEYN